MENVREAVYLGVKFSEDGRMEGESWVLREKEKARLQTAEMNVLRKFAGVTRLEHIRNEEVRQRLQQRSILDVVREKRESWRVKVMETLGSLMERVMAGEVEGRRPRGRPRKRWRDPF